MNTSPPFRADHVGSLLRPKFLLDARAAAAKGEITATQLREVEDRAIDNAIKLQEDVGLQSITDGEFRRTYFHIDFFGAIGRCQNGHSGHDQEAGWHRGTRAASDARHRQGSARQRHPAR